MNQTPRSTLAYAIIGFALMLPVLTVSQSAVASRADVTSLVAKKTAIVSKMHKKASKALVNSAQDKTFQAYFHSHGDERHEHKKKIEQVTLAVQSNFHVEEMCLIAADGVELTRIVGSEIAPDSDLSSDETGAVFFQPGFDQAPKKINLSPVYMSPDAKKWVLAYTTPIAVSGEKPAILHYEHGLDVYQAALNKGVEGDGLFILAVADGGYVVSDSRSAINIAMDGDNEEMSHYFKNLASVAGEGLSQIYASIGDEEKGSATFKQGDRDYAVAFSKVGGWTILAVQQL